MELEEIFVVAYKITRGCCESHLTLKNSVCMCVPISLSFTPPHTPGRESKVSDLNWHLLRVQNMVAEFTRI